MTHVATAEQGRERWSVEGIWDWRKAKGKKDIRLRVGIKDGEAMA